MKYYSELLNRLYNSEAELHEAEMAREMEAQREAEAKKLEEEKRKEYLAQKAKDAAEVKEAFEAAKAKYAEAQDKLHAYAEKYTTQESVRDLFDRQKSMFYDLFKLR